MEKYSSSAAKRSKVNRNKIAKQQVSNGLLSILSSDDLTASMTSFFTPAIAQRFKLTSKENFKSNTLFTRKHKIVALNFPFQELFQGQDFDELIDNTVHYADLKRCLDDSYMMQKKYGFSQLDSEMLEILWGGETNDRLLSLRHLLNGNLPANLLSQQLDKRKVFNLCWCFALITKFDKPERRFYPIWLWLKQRLTEALEQQGYSKNIKLFLKIHIFSTETEIFLRKNISSLSEDDYLKIYEGATNIISLVNKNFFTKEWYALLIQGKHQSDYYLRTRVACILQEQYKIKPTFSNLHNALLKLIELFECHPELIDKFCVKDHRLDDILFLISANLYELTIVELRECIDFWLEKHEFIKHRLTSEELRNIGQSFLRPITLERFMLLKKIWRLFNLEYDLIRAKPVTVDISVLPAEIASRTLKENQNQFDITNIAYEDFFALNTAEKKTLLDLKIKINLSHNIIKYCAQSQKCMADFSGIAELDSNVAFALTVFMKQDRNRLIRISVKKLRESVRLLLMLPERLAIRFSRNFGLHNLEKLEKYDKLLMDMQTDSDKYVELIEISNNEPEVFYDFYMKIAASNKFSAEEKKLASNEKFLQLYSHFFDSFKPANKNLPMERFPDYDEFDEVVKKCLDIFKVIFELPGDLFNQIVEYPFNCQALPLLVSNDDFIRLSKAYPEKMTVFLKKHGDLYGDFFLEVCGDLEKYVEELMRFLFLVFKLDIFLDESSFSFGLRLLDYYYKKGLVEMSETNHESRKLEFFQGLYANFLNMIERGYSLETALTEVELHLDNQKIYEFHEFDESELTNETFEEGMHRMGILCAKFKY